jgi:hypothetical protein
MHRVSSRTYLGRPNETVSLTTNVDGGGQVNVTLDGQAIAGETQFQLPSGSGSQSTLQIGLFGPIGAACVVGISPVDGGTDGDFLLCQVHNPAPVHFYTFSVTSPASLAAFAKIKKAKAARKPRRKRGRK